ncbi:MAG: hypothetical protein EXR71_10850 [Myxococcales bacterium]|nr:hypothetical protein [Myxococcales bacterium]
MPRPPTPSTTSAPTWQPWFELYLAASLCDCCFDAAVRQIPALPLKERGDAWAIATRAMLTLGRAAEAGRAWTLARAMGGVEVDALALWMEPGALPAAVQRATTARSPGFAADAWCEVAALRMLNEAGRDAALAIGRALAACPEHREALRWARFLALPEAPEAVARLALKPTRRGANLAVRDADGLIPRSENGFVSPMRAQARVWREAIPIPHGSALARFDRAGVTASYLATPEDWARVPEGHPLVPVELALGQLVDLVDEGREATPPARSAWNSALASGDAERVDDVAQLLCALATRAPALAGLAARAADWLVETRGSRGRLFAAYRAWFAALLGEADAAHRARTVLADPCTDDLGWRLAVEALARAGAPSDADVVIAAAGRDPRRRGATDSLGGRRAPTGAPQVAVSPRLTPRDLTAAACPVALA